MIWRALLVGLFPLLVWAAPPDARYPGGIARIVVSDATTQATFQGKQVLITETPEGRIALVGLPLDLDPGTHSLETDQGALAFTVTSKQYLEQRITLSNTRQVNPLPLDLERIRGEAKNQREAVAAFRATNPELTLILPVEGPISGPFGKRRFFNNQPRRPHAGTDIAAPLGTPLKAAGSGLVTLVGDFFFNGRLVVIDHGQGLITMYCHMDQIEVVEGQSVTQGTRIGTVGATGRVTGPHLHLGVALNEAWIDPALMIPEINTLPQ